MTLLTKMVKVEYLIDHASNEKGAKKEMPESTAKALERHKVLKIVNKEAK